MKASKLIQMSYSLAGILDPEEQIPAAYAEQGIIWLNILIAKWSSNPNAIMFLDPLSFTTRSSVYQYTVSLEPGADVNSTPISMLSTANVISAGVKSPLVQVFEKQQNIQNYTQTSGLPYTIYLQQEELTTNVFLYPTPSANYVVNMLVKSRRSRVETFEELLEITERAQAAYIYELAAMLADYWQVPRPSQIEQNRQSFVDDFLGANSIGLAVNRDAGLQSFNRLWFNNNGNQGIF